MKRLVLTAVAIALAGSIGLAVQIFATAGTPAERLDALDPLVADLEERVFVLEGKANTYTGSIGSEAAAPRTNIKVLESIIVPPGRFGSFTTVTGIVRSDDPFPVRFVKITATIRRADDGTLVTTDLTFADKDLMLPGETSTFDILVSNDDLPTDTEWVYELEVTGASRVEDAATS